jgi:hypothetical protein
MTKFARMENQTAVEVFTPPEGMELSDCFHADVAALFSPCPDNVTQGSTITGKGVWTIAPEPSPAPEPAPVYPKVGPIAFQMLFSPAEMVAAGELRATDKALASFWKLIDDPRTDTIDLNLAMVQSAIEYTLTAIKAAGVDIDVAARKAAILSGVLS